MHTTLTWDEKLHFTSRFGDNAVTMDAKAPVGTGRAPSPKELFLASICGCSAMDVVSWVRKGKKELKSFAIDAKTELTKGQPSVFVHVFLTFRSEGDAPDELVVEAVEKSMTLYCGVSAMVVKSCPISYEIIHNGRKLGEGQAAF